MCSLVEVRVIEEYRKTDSPLIDTEGHIRLKDLVNNRVWSLRNDPEKRQGVLACMINEGHALPVRKGRYIVHPHLREAL